MPKVWESTVSAWVRSEWPARFRVESGYLFGLTDHQEMQSEADIVVFDKEALVALYDAKYKWPDKAPTAADVCQMVTYRHRLNLEAATLVYPVETQQKSSSVRGKALKII